jgi:hypothetical protein
MGHANNDRMKKVGGLSAARIVKRILLHLHPEETRGIHETPFAPPRGYRAVKLCTLSGQLAKDTCTDVRLEYFKPGTEPVLACGVHSRYALDRRTGGLAGVHTPAAQVEFKTFVTLPPEYSAWAARMGYEQPPVETAGIPRASIEISNPADNSRIMLDPETPLKFQTLSLEAKVVPAIPRIIWIVDGKPLQPVSYPYVLRWQLEAGQHTFQACFPNADVRSEPVTVQVSEY